MNAGLKMRIARVERHHGRGDWRQFGDDPRDMPDWALVAAILSDLENDPRFLDCAELLEVRRLYDAGDTAASFKLLGSVISSGAPRK
jgi:hypothetical protein